MIVRTRTNGNVLELEDETAEILIKNKIYEEASDEEKKAFRKTVNGTAVSPLTTGDVPRQPKRRKTG